ncbi:MAG: hypothetical protein LBR11_11870 [Deltaproteobacteria bacterium]|nr:hypothetical protein [Deltaproteobacteria bacterium]
MKKGLTDFNDLVVSKGPEKGFEEIKQIVSSAEKEARFGLGPKLFVEQAPLAKKTSIWR